MAVRRAARVSHNHVAAVFDADRAAGTAYAVTEWTGGISLSDRIEAGDSPPIAEFLSNAAGLADGLASLHEEDAVHGAIDPGAVLYPGSHPAKLGGFGRPRLTRTPGGDVRALGSTLETALTGHPAGVLPPSQVIDALPPAVDDALRLARESRIDARRLAEVVRSIPYSPAPRRPARWSWGRLAPTAVLASAAIALVWLGVLLDSRGRDTGRTRPTRDPDGALRRRRRSSPAGGDDATGAGYDGAPAGGRREGDRLRSFG